MRRRTRKKRDGLADRPTVFRTSGSGVAEAWDRAGFVTSQKLAPEVAEIRPIQRHSDELSSQMDEPFHIPHIVIETFRQAVEILGPTVVRLQALGATLGHQQSNFVG